MVWATNTATGRLWSSVKTGILGKAPKELVEKILTGPPKQIVLSGPSGYVGQRVLSHLLEIQMLRKERQQDTGRIILLSSSPGNLMSRLHRTYGAKHMNSVAASRVDYYTQHDEDTWIDHLGSLGLGGQDSVFINMAGVAGPKAGIPNAMMDANYHAAIAAAKASAKLGFGHWIQTSTQATHAERAGQVPYSKAKGMTDHALSRLTTMPVSIACLGMLYNKEDFSIGQDSKGRGGKGHTLNLKDFAILPLTPILGSGKAPLQPQEVSCAALRIAVLACLEPSSLPCTKNFSAAAHRKLPENHRFYDAVGPETISFEQMLAHFAKFQGNTHFRPVYIDYRNMERIVNLITLGNLNRQFISLLRSEQDAEYPTIGNCTDWERILGPDAQLATLDESLAASLASNVTPYSVIFKTILQLCLRNPRIIPPGINLNFEILHSYLRAVCKSRSEKYK